tara:strand:- start:34 stop:1497 length:1464 start_codon:yes stop_codon:yes gene_type:complete
MSFKPLTQDKESLQALAFSMRQEKGSDITQDELKEAMMDLSQIKSSVRKCCDIDYSKLTNRFNNWYEVGSEKDVEEWTNSSVWVANSVIPSRFIKGSDYVFSNEIGDPTFRGAFREIAKDISKNAKDSVVKKIYSSLAKGTGDKWNPADVLAIKKSKMSQITNQMKAFQKGNPTYKSSSTIGNVATESLDIVKDMEMLYQYNQFVDDNYKSGNCVPISLKKVSATSKEIKAQTTPSVKVKSFDHKEAKGIQDSLNLKLDVTNVKYEPTNAKCIVEFTLAGEKGHVMDIRGFQSGMANDVQMQLQKGSAANHGKATLGTFTLITKLSQGRIAFSKQRALLRKLFPKKKIPTGSSRERHAFTAFSIFVDYDKKATGDFSKRTFKMDIPIWAEYLEFLSGKKHKKKDTISYLVKTCDQNPTAALKWLKNKVQSYEVGQVVDKAQTQIKSLVKESIMKSIYTQAASKGFRIFRDKKITDYMSASSYLKVGG